MSTAQLVRTTVAASLVLGAALTLVSIATMPDFAGDSAVRLEAIAASPGTAGLSSLTWVLAQLFVAVGVLGVAHLLRSRVPVLAVVAGVLVLVGAFGHAVYGGVNLTMLAMARDLGAVEAHAAVLDHLEAGLAIPFMAAGLLGTVLGFVALGVAVWRGRLGPRWLGPALVLFVLLEFVGTNVTEWAGVAAGALYAVAFVTMAVVVWRSSITHWQTATEAAQPVDERVTA